MAICTIISVDKLHTKPQQRVLGVFSSETKAWKIFSTKVGHFPFTTGVFRYSNEEMFSSALQEKLQGDKSILIYADTNIDIYIRWDVVDKFI